MADMNLQDEDGEVSFKEQDSSTSTGEEKKRCLDDTTFLETGFQGREGQTQKKIHKEYIFY